jgi:drug/metabolite transporter (DMT)-like permease
MGESAALASSAMWAAASLLFAGLGARMGALGLNLLKCCLAAAGLVLTLWLVEGAPWPRGLDATATAWLAASGLVGLTIGDTAFFHALVRLGPRRALLLWALVPPTTAMAAVPLLGEPVSLPLVVGMALSMGGVTWVIRERSGGPDGGVADGVRVGLVLGLVSVLCQAGGNILTKLGGAEISALGISVVRLLFGTAGILLHAMVAGAVRPAFRVLRDRGQLGRLLFATFIGTYLGLWLVNAGLRYTDAGVASTLSSLSPIFVLPLARIFLGERLSARAIVGACVACAGVAVLFLGR